MINRHRIGTQMGWGVMVVLTLLLSARHPSAAAAEQQQAYTLKLQTAPGERWSFDVSTAIKQKGEVTANGQPAQAIDQSANQRRKGTLEVLAVADGKPTAIKVTFDAQSANTGTLGGQAAPAFALAGKTITLRREGANITNDLPEQPDEQTRAELDRLLDPDTSVYPTRPVAVNEEWDADAGSLGRQFQLGNDDKVSMKCKLLAVKDIGGGRQVADVSLAGEVVKHDQGFVETTTTLNGVTRIDVASGQVLNADILGKMSSRGNRTANDASGKQVAIAVNADGTLEMHQQVRPLGASAAPAAEASAPAATPSGNVAVMKPADAKATTADNPPAPRPPASIFNGSFKGDELSIDLSADEGDRYTGTMRLRDKQFPVTAHAEGARLLGTFQSGGTNFDFSASLDGDTLKLTSGGSDYTMRRAGGSTSAENPLGKPAPKNPLGQ